MTVGVSGTNISQSQTKRNNISDSDMVGEVLVCVKSTNDNASFTGISINYGLTSGSGGFVVRRDNPSSASSSKLPIYYHKISIA